MTHASFPSHGWPPVEHSFPSILSTAVTLPAVKDVVEPQHGPAGRRRPADGPAHEIVGRVVGMGVGADPDTGRAVGADRRSSSGNRSRSRSPSAGRRRSAARSPDGMAAPGQLSAHLRQIEQKSTTEGSSPGASAHQRQIGGHHAEPHPRAQAAASSAGPCGRSRRGRRRAPPAGR